MSANYGLFREIIKTRSRNRVARGHLGDGAIIEIGISSIEQQILNVSPEIRSSLIRIMSDYLKQVITYNQAHAAFVSFSGTGEPIDRLREIIEVSDEPIPFTEDEDDSTNPSRRKMRTWSTYEDVRLLAGIYRYGIDNWAPISKFVGNGRTRAQCAQRWARGLNPRICKDTWDPAEDMRLMQLVQQYGDKSWTKIASSLGNRSDVQCRYHYHQLTKDMNQMIQIQRQQPVTAFPTAMQQPVNPVATEQLQPQPVNPSLNQPINSSINSSINQSVNQSVNQSQAIPIRPYFAMRPPPRFSMPMISPIPQFDEFVQPNSPSNIINQENPPLPSPSRNLNNNLNASNGINQHNAISNINNLNNMNPNNNLNNVNLSDDVNQSNYTPQMLPRVFENQTPISQQSAIPPRRASHFLIPPIDPKFEMPMKAMDPPVRFSQIEKMEQNKTESRRVGVSSNIDDFLNKFQQ
ncbi:Myb-like DNA-binding domain containing protein [Tritrichomonas foetus]|uniref:Myb-like DNA-binding domain containing protein n=1 Tax=Tritrichomonas foetus TaxID=1144522 RepID=A0A1J4KTN5_9EUKA|nr:Myb-like DNA-binding domain containing protein [Tritrichomonas foetus]|eukprot:OHT13030.1 Myb-like DNA-binding domain containing protein [Tritrichomonas foetus]